MSAMKRSIALTALLFWTAGLAADAPGARLAELERLALAGDERAVLSLLEDTVKAPQGEAAAAESVLLEFTQSLKWLPAWSVDAKVLAFLRTYEPRVMAEHPDHPAAKIPRYNIRAAAAGVENEWRRQQAVAEGGYRLATDPDRFVVDYIASQPGPERQGLLDALAMAGPLALGVVAHTAAGASETHASAAELAFAAAALVQDTGTLASLIGQGHGAGHHALAHLAKTLPAIELRELFDAALAGPDTMTAGLAIAQLAPRLLHLPEVEDRLFGLLDHPELGAAAALTLSLEAEPGRVGRLASIAGRESPGAARARMALDLVKQREPQR